MKLIETKTASGEKLLLNPTKIEAICKKEPHGPSEVLVSSQVIYRINNKDLESLIEDINAELNQLHEDIDGISETIFRYEK